MKDVIKQAQIRPEGPQPRSLVYIYIARNGSSGRLSVWVADNADNADNMADMEISDGWVVEGKELLGLF